jgi:hypothetical protein
MDLLSTGLEVILKKIQVFTPTSAALFIAAGVGLFFYFRHEKQRMLEERGPS